jgi:uncharacterized membrane protein YbhN (UPF0104 family)
MDTKIKKSLNFLLRTVIVLATYGFLFYELFVNEKFNSFHFQNPETNASLFLVFFVLSLMPINWGLESLKWQLLMRKVELIKFGAAFKAIFIGSAISFFAPNRMGDFIGRVFILKKGDRMEGIFATIVGNLGQLFVTLILGSSALLLFLPQLNETYLGFSHFQLVGTIALVILTNLFLLAVFLNIGLLHTIVQRLKIIDRWLFLRHLQILQNFNRAELLQILGLSAFRFLIYSIQFYLVFYSFGIRISPIQGIFIVFILFFILTAIPTIAFAELGVRGLVSLFILELLIPKMAFTDTTETAIVAASSTLWFINLAIPAILGTFFVYELKFFRKND